MERDALEFSISRSCRSIQIASQPAALAIVRIAFSRAFASRVHFASSNVVAVMESERALAGTAGTCFPDVWTSADDFPTRAQGKNKENLWQ